MQLAESVGVVCGEVVQAGMLAEEEESNIELNVGGKIESLILV